MINARKKSAHTLPFHELYPSWGLAGHQTSEAARHTSTLTRTEVDIPTRHRAQAILNNTIGMYRLDPYELIYCQAVEHFDGTAIPAVHLRYEREDEQHRDFGGEHLSAVIDVSNKRILSFVHMPKAQAEGWVDHRTALHTALCFLQKAAPDLVKTTDTLPEINDADALTPGLAIDCGEYRINDHLALCWMANHPEKFHHANGKPYLGSGTHGIKVKLRFSDNSGRSAWVIIDGDGDIQVMERSILWDADHGKRLTQMWCHDGWLFAHQLT